MNKKKSVIYVNFSPYENSGKILDFLISSFSTVIVFTFNFHRLGSGQESSKLKVYRGKKLIETNPLYQIPVPEQFIFLLLPIRSTMILLQIIFHVVRLNRRYETFDTYFTVNAFTAWVGNILKKLGMVRETVFWVWDYYPPVHPNKIILFMRWLYWQFDKRATHADRLVFLNRRLETLRKDIGILPKDRTYTIIPIGTNPIRREFRQPHKPTLGFVGVLKKSQGLDKVFDEALLLRNEYPRISLDIIGAGPDERYFRHLAKQRSLPTAFHGLLPITDPRARKILSQISIGLAPYIPDESNVSFYGDPSKIKDYLSFGIPVITTFVFIFSRVIANEKAGIIIDYFKPGSLIRAVKKILHDYSYYSQNALNLSQKYYYQKIYPRMFDR